MITNAQFEYDPNSDRIVFRARSDRSERKYRVRFDRDAWADPAIRSQVFEKMRALEDDVTTQVQQRDVDLGTVLWEDCWLPAAPPKEIGARRLEMNLPL